jgi:hypothetical protein
MANSGKKLKHKWTQCPCLLLKWWKILKEPLRSKSNVSKKSLCKMNNLIKYHKNNKKNPNKIHKILQNKK